MKHRALSSTGTTSFPTFNVFLFFNNLSGPICLNPAHRSNNLDLHSIRTVTVLIPLIGSIKAISTYPNS